MRKLFQRTPIVLLVVVLCIGFGFWWQTSNQQPADVDAKGLQPGNSPVAAHNLTDVSGKPVSEDRGTQAPVQPQSGMRQSADETFVATIELQRPRAPGPLLAELYLGSLEDPPFEEIHLRGFGDRMQVSLAAGGYAVESVLIDGWPMDFEVKGSDALSPKHHSIQVQIRDLGARLEVVDSKSEEPIRDVQVYRSDSGRSFQTKIDAWLLEDVQEDPWLEGTSPLFLPQITARTLLWVTAPGYGWMSVEPFQQPITRKIRLQRSCQVLLVPSKSTEADNAALTRTKVLVSLQSGTETRTQAVRIGPPTLLGRLPEGQAHLRIAMPSDLGPGFELWSGKLDLVPGECPMIPVALPDNSKPMKSASLSLRLVSDRDLGIPWKGQWTTPSGRKIESFPLAKLEFDLNGHDRFPWHSHQHLQHLQPGTYRLSLLPAMIERTVVLSAGETSELRVDLSPVCKVTLQATGNPGDSFDRGRISFEWSHLPLDGANEQSRRQQLSFTQGKVNALYTLPGTIFLRSTSPSWHFPAPQIQVPAIPHSTIEFPVEHQSIYILSLQFEDWERLPPSKIPQAESLVFEPVDHNGRCVGSRRDDFFSTWSHPNSDQNYPMVMAYFSKPGAYRMTSKTGAFPPLTVEVEVKNSIHSITLKSQ